VLRPEPLWKHSVWNCCLILQTVWPHQDLIERGVESLEYLQEDQSLQARVHHLLGVRLITPSAANCRSQLALPQSSLQLWNPLPA